MPRHAVASRGRWGGAGRLRRRFCQDQLTRWAPSNPWRPRAPPPPRRPVQGLIVTAGIMYRILHALNIPLHVQEASGPRPRRRPSAPRPSLSAHEAARLARLDLSAARPPRGRAPP
jgi:hypothetical protein